MLPRHGHLLGQMGKGEGSRAAIEPAVAVLPCNTVKDDGRELVGGNREIGFGDAAQDGASRHVHCGVVLKQRTRDHRLQKIVQPKQIAG